jgi:gluconokinase
VINQIQPYILGVDIGTGSTKAVACNFNGRILGSAQYHYPVSSPKPGYSEQDPELILSAFISCVKDMVIETGHAPDAISFSSAMHSLIMVDIDGIPLAPMMTWADSRSEDIAAKLRASSQASHLYRTCGTPIHAMSPLSKLMWLRENEKELFAKAYKFISIKEYLWYFLFSEYRVDYSLASSSGMFDISALEWSEEALELAGTNATRLSVPVATTTYRDFIDPKAAELLTLPAKTPVIIGASDGGCANLGSFVNKPGVASLTIGTSGAVRITSNVPVIDDTAMVFNYLLDTHTYVCGGAINNGGIALDWLLKTFLPGATYKEAFEQIATIQAGSNGLLFLPYLYGERAPLWDTKTCGTFFNIKPEHTHTHFLRAGLEGICFALNDVLQTLEKASSTIEQVHISGGFISSEVWTQLLADITGKKLLIIQQEDASAIGAVFLAMKALNLPPVQQPVSDAVIIPDMNNHTIYQKNFTVFKKLYKDLADTMHWAHDNLK